ncbi:MAG TPA: methionine synthase [Thermoclostridium sp.]|nr:methionine synthase [Clostridiaceae bacterium]HOQ76644.1 methionine synthase [Thermoclostridium sp.]HPU45894.1 methionine synthase [Thermoclostridium sp.]
MESIKILRGIRPSYNRNLILTRLGYKRGVTGIGEDFGQLLDSTVKRAEDHCSLVLAYRVVGISENDGGTLRLEDGTVLSGKALSEMLSQSQKAVLMASTAGPRIMEEIRTLMDAGRASEAVIMDAAASEIADAGLDFLMEYIGAYLRRQGKALTKHRFSPGYGDFGIEQQAHFARLLEIEKLGIRMTDTCMLVPEKSVLAIAGIVDIKMD